MVDGTQHEVESRAQATADNTSQTLEESGAHAASAALIDEVNETRLLYDNMYGAGSAAANQSFQSYLAETAESLFEGDDLFEVSGGFAEANLAALSRGDMQLSMDDLKIAAAHYSEGGGNPNALAYAMISTLVSRYGEVASQVSSGDFAQELATGITFGDLNAQLLEQAEARQGMRPLGQSHLSALGNFFAANPNLNGVFTRDQLQATMKAMRSSLPPNEEFDVWADRMAALEMMDGSFNFLSNDGVSIDTRSFALFADPARSENNQDAVEILNGLQTSAVFQEGMVPYDVATQSLKARAALTGETVNHNAIVRECNRIMTLNGFERAAIDGITDRAITVHDLPRDWNRIANYYGRPLTLYSPEDLMRFEQMVDARFSKDGPNAPAVLDVPEYPPRGWRPPAAQAAVEQQSYAAPESQQPAWSNAAPEQQSWNAPAAGYSVDWDPMLTAVNASIVPVEGLQPGEKYWKIVKADFKEAGNGDGQAKGMHHIIYHVQDDYGNDIAGAGILMKWPDGESPERTKSGDPYSGNSGNIPMYAKVPAGNAGPYSAFATEGGYRSEGLGGAGLIGGEHVVYEVYFQLVTAP